MRRGKLITLEGIDGAGKSTALEILRSDAEVVAKRRLLFEAEPSKRKVGMFLREKLKSDGSARLADPHYVEQLALLMAADRVEHYYEVLEPHLESGGNVLCDRYAWSSYAYQCALGVAPEFVEMVNDAVAVPDLVVYLHVVPEVAVKRISSGRESTELFESLQHLKQVYAKYNWLLSERTGIKSVDATPRVVIDAKLSPTEVAVKILTAVDAALLVL